MNDLEHGHHPHSDNETSEHRSGKERERHGWPFWVTLVLALVALAFYTLTGELGGFFPRQPVQSMPTAIGK